MVLFRKLTWKPKKGPRETTVPLKKGYRGLHVSLGECSAFNGSARPVARPRGLRAGGPRPMVISPMLHEEWGRGYEGLSKLWSLFGSPKLGPVIIGTDKGTIILTIPRIRDLRFRDGGLGGCT